MTAAFYKNVQSGGLLSAPMFVHAPGYSLTADTHLDYVYPVDGWYWFDSQSQAEAFFATSSGAPSTAITKLAFRNRFTFTEKVTIEFAQIDDATAPMQARQAAAALRSSQSDIQAAKWVDLARVDTIAGVRALETYRVIGTGRASIILETPIAPEERP